MIFLGLWELAAKWKMFGGRVLCGQVCVCEKLRSVVHHVSRNLLKTAPGSPCHTFHTDSHPYGCTANEKTTECESLPIPISSDLGRLLSIESRYELYHFLRRFTVTKMFNDEIQCMFLLHKVRIDFPYMMNLVDMYTWNSGIDGLLMMKSCSETWYPQETEALGGLIPHKMLCESINEPLLAMPRLLDKAYTNVWPKAVVLSQVELLMNKVISSGSQCTVDKVNKFLASDYCSELKGPVLCSSWVSFYLSPYENDLRIAASILENNELVMMPYLDRTLSQVAEYLLDERQLNRYFALLQLFAKRSHQKKMKHLLELLFKHFYNSNNFRGCSTCISLAHDLKLKLTADVLFKFELMLKRRRYQKDMTFIF